jgi:hypothetical protein
MDMATDIRQRFFFVFVFFLVCMLIFHLYVHLKRPTARWLKGLDYVWLGFAALSLLGAAFEQRRFVAEHALESSSYQFISAVEPILGLAHTDYRVECDMLGGLKSEIETVRADCAWLTKLKDYLADLDKLIASRDASPASRASKIADQVEKFVMPNGLPADFAGDANEIEGYLNSAKGSIPDYRFIREAADKDNPITDLLTFFSPYFIAIALSVRFAKLYGELRI